MTGAGLEGSAAPERSGLVLGVLAAVCFLIVIATSRLEAAAVGRILIPAGAILAAIAAGQVLARRHPDEPWLPTLLVTAVAVKLAGSILRFYTLVNEEGFHGVMHGAPSLASVTRTFEYEGYPGHVSLETLTFEERGGKTRVRVLLSGFLRHVDVTSRPTPADTWRMIAFWKSALGEQ